MAKLTYEAVADAADELAKAAQTPSQRTLIEKLGGGSYSTIGPHLRRWRAARDAITAAASATDTPRHLEIDLAVANVLRRSQADVRAELQSDLDDQAKEIEQLTTERDTESSRAAELEASGAALRRQVDQLNGQLEELRRELDTTRQERATAATALEDLRGRHGQIMEAKSTLESHVIELESAAVRQAEARAALEQRAVAAATAQAGAEQLLSTTAAELEAKLAVEHRARSEAEQRVLVLLSAIDGHSAKLERLAAAEATEKVLREQVELLTTMLKPGGAR